MVYGTWLSAAVVALTACAGLALAEQVSSAAPEAAANNVPGITVISPRDAADEENFPATAASVSQEQMRATVNGVDVEDAAKYLPSVFVRKRNYGDTQPVIATRNWGLNSSARTLVFVDDIPISALVANNNTLGAPRWGMVSPEQIDRIDMLYGPYSSEFSGNSMGGVMRIVTRSPEKTEFTLDQTEALQSFSLYHTDNHYLTSQTSATAGGRSGAFSWFLGGTFQNSFSQPLSFITASTVPADTAGAIPANNKLGQRADVLGVGGLLHTREANVLGRFGYDLTDAWHLTYLIDYWRNDADSDVSSYLLDAAARPTYGRVGGFASNDYHLIENHLMNGLSIKSDSHGSWDGETVVTHYDFLEDGQASPAGVTGTGFSPNGRLADLGGTSWGTIDLKGIWRPRGTDGPHLVSFGAHADRYVLNNPTYNTAAWQDADTRNTLYSSGRGRTETEALWAQDVWRLGAAWQATIGGRVEHWGAGEGFNFSGSTAVVQPRESAAAFSPSATLRWSPAADWTLTASVARAVRFPTVSELYQLISTGGTYSSPNPDLEPERDLAGELAIEHSLGGGSLRVSLFQENTRDALISQTSTLAGFPVPVTFVVNVGEVRNRGVEIAGQQTDLGLRGFDVAGSVTFVDSAILSNDAFASSAGTTSQGRHAPYVPRWRATLVATYRPAERWALTAAARYSGRMYSTVDNTDTTSDVFGAFDSFTVIDIRLHCDITGHLSAALGVDNVNDRKYFLYHPFPQRTVVGNFRMKF